MGRLGRAGPLRSGRGAPRAGAAGRFRARRARRAAPSSGSITSTPRSRRSSRFRCVAASRYMRSFIAGATSRGASQARKEVVSIESAVPAASFEIVLAEAGATRKASQPSASARWPIGSCFGHPRPASRRASGRGPTRRRGRARRRFPRTMPRRRTASPPRSSRREPRGPAWWRGARAPGPGRRRCRQLRQAGSRIDERCQPEAGESHAKRLYS